MGEAGPSSCSGLASRQARDYYGRLSRAWPEGLHRFLSNDPPPNMTDADLVQIVANPQACRPSPSLP